MGTRDPFEALAICPACAEPTQSFGVAMPSVQGRSVWCAPCCWTFSEEVGMETSAAAVEPRRDPEGLSDADLGRFVRSAAKVLAVLDDASPPSDRRAGDVALDLRFAQSIRFALSLTREALGPDESEQP